MLGASRSGTSAVSRLLNLLGVDLGGKDRLLRPDREVNPKGFYEHRDIMLLNTELLRRFGGGWDDPPEMADGWEDDPALGDLRSEARAVLERDFGSAALWGFKDPRACFTLPFWQPLLGKDALFVFCYRDPIEVAESVRSRDGIPLEDAVLLWSRSTTAALLHTKGLPRLVIGNAELLADPEPALLHLAAFIGAEERLADPTIRAAVDEWLEPGLRHHAQQLADTLQHPALPTDARQLALLLEVAVRERDSEPALRGQGVAGTVNDALDHEAYAIELSRRRPQVHKAPSGAAVRGHEGTESARAAPDAAMPPGPTSNTPDASIVVLVYETPDDARTLVQSIVVHTREAYELVLVDNGSGPQTRRALEQLAHEVGATLVRQSENTTFAGGSNAGVRAASAAEIVLLNSDCIVGDRWLTNLRAVLACAEDVVAAGPRSNSAHLAQGGIWLDDTSQASVQLFASRFNHSDPGRWFEVDWLIGFAMLVRREAFDAVGGFDESIRTGDGEDRDLCQRLRAAGGRLMCAGDTFIFHVGQGTYTRAGLNRTTIRYGYASADVSAREVVDGKLVREASGRVFEVVGDVAFHVETGTVLRLLRESRTIEDAQPGELDGVTFGLPTCLVREGASERVWLLRQGCRQLVEGDPHRIRRLPGLAIAEASDLALLPIGPSIAVEKALPAVPDIKPLLPFNPAAIDEDRLLGPRALADRVAAALDCATGYALIALDHRDTRILHDNAWTLADAPAFTSAQTDPTPAVVRRAVLDADAVRVPTRRDAAVCAPLLEQVLFHLDLYPRALCGLDIGCALLGFDAVSGEQLERGPLREVLDGRRVAVVGPLAHDALRWAADIGIDVTVAIGHAGSGSAQSVVDALAKAAGACDVALTGGGPYAAELCTRAARELGLVALDVGHALERLLYVRHGFRDGRDVAEQWAVERYLRATAEPPPDEPHPLEGKLVQAEGTAGVYLVERGLARALRHRELLALFDQSVERLAAEEVEALPRGLALGAIYDRRRGPQLLIGGQLVGLDFGVPFHAVDRVGLEGVRSAGRRVPWFPRRSL